MCRFVRETWHFQAPSVENTFCRSGQPGRPQAERKCDQLVDNVDELWDGFVDRLNALSSSTTTYAPIGRTNESENNENENVANDSLMPPPGRTM